jgi:C4-dicarboxylate transporter DctM subunit
MDLALWLPFAVLALLLVGRMPIAFAMALAGGLGLWLTLGGQATLGVFTAGAYRHSASLLLTTIPMFILMAELLSQGSIVKEMFAAAASWTGRFRGGLAMSTVLANTGFAALSGSSTAAAGALARISVPEMRKQGYDDRLSVGTVASAGTFAATIPPSIILIIYGVITETSVSQLFVAGIIPGLLTAVGYLLAIAVWVRLRPNVAGPPVTSSWAEKWRSLAKIWPAVLLVLLVVVGIYSGAVTPTEAGGVGAALALLISVAFGGLRWRQFVKALRGTIQVSSMIIMIIIGAGIFGTYMSTTRIAPRLFTAIENARLGPLAVILIIIAIYLVLGTFMDSIAMMVLTLPLTFPLAVGSGYDAVWFGILVVKCAEIGLITPPLGLNVYVASSVAKAEIGKAFAGSARFVVVELVIVAALLAIPSLALYLPGHM